MKLYFDTSFVNYLFAEDTPLKMADTLALWEDILQGKYEVFLSDTTIIEIEKCDDPRLSLMKEKLSEIEYTHIANNAEIKALASQYIKNKILPAKSELDSMHIASAAYAECDMIVSWNFKHLVNVRTNDGVRYVNKVNNYKEIQIVSPNMLVANPKS